MRPSDLPAVTQEAWAEGGSWTHLANISPRGQHREGNEMPPCQKLSFLKQTSHRSWKNHCSESHSLSIQRHAHITTTSTYLIRKMI